MHNKPQPSSTPTGFRKTHCMNCQGGLVRTTTKGATIVWCLVDREPILEDIASCNKFKQNEPR